MRQFLVNFIHSTNPIRSICVSDARLLPWIWWEWFFMPGIMALLGVTVECVIFVCFFFLGGGGEGEIFLSRLYL